MPDKRTSTGKVTPNWLQPGGVSLKTINNQSLLGTGNITISGGASDIDGGDASSTESEIIDCGNA